MTMTRMIGWTGLMLLASMTMGCNKTFDLCFTNGTNQVREIVLTDPDGMTRQLVVAQGQQRHMKLELDPDSLPANCSVQMGNMVNRFSLDKKMADKQFFAIEDTGVIGPVGEHVKIVTDTKRKVDVRTDQRTVITGDQPAVAPPANVPPSGGTGNTGGSKTIIRQQEVVE